jgi:photosystem II stability/assembly factor-like uncharacterized protein
MLRKLIPGLIVMTLIFVTWFLSLDSEGSAVLRANESYAWQQVESMTTSDLSDVAMLSASDGWAVGGSTFLHWDGTSWTPESTTPPGFYNSVSMVSATDGWAVGGEGKVARWNGSSWQEFTTLPGEPSLSGVDAVAAGDVWMVGDDGLILHWDGGTLSAVASPVDDRLMQVHMVSADEGYIVGFDFDPIDGVILRWDGSAWTEETIPDTGRLFDIAAAAPAEPWAVGENGRLLHKENGLWDNWTNPLRGKARQNQIIWLMGIDMLAPDSGWMVGGYFDESFIARWDGTAWTAVASPFGTFLQAVDMVSETDGWAVGYEGTILRYATAPQPDGWSVYLPLVRNAPS